MPPLISVSIPPFTPHHCKQPAAVSTTHPCTPVQHQCFLLPAASIFCFGPTDAPITPSPVSLAHFCSDSSSAPGCQATHLQPTSLVAPAMRLHSTFSSHCTSDGARFLSFFPNERPCLTSLPCPLLWPISVHVSPLNCRLHGCMATATCLLLIAFFRLSLHLHPCSRASAD